MDYRGFVKQHFNDFEGSAPTRMKKIAELWRKQKGGTEDSFDAGKKIAGKSIAGKSIAGKKIAGKKIAGKSIAGKSIAGKSIAGKKIAGKSISGKKILGGPDSLPDWIKKGVSYDEWRSEKQKNIGGFGQALLPFFPMLLPLIRPIIQPLVNKIIGSGEITPKRKKELERLMQFA
jgi:hypothetical protein